MSRAPIYTHFVLPWLQGERYAGLSARLAELRARERLDLEHNRALAWQEVQLLLHYAYTQVPYYRELFAAAGATPDDIRVEADFQRLPALTREVLRSKPGALVAKGIPRDQMREAATGGTTDTPVPLWRNVECIQQRTAVQVRLNQWAGLDTGMKVMWLWGARTDYPADPSWKWRMFETHVMRRVWCPISILDEETFKRYLQTLNDFKPQAIVAYPAPLALFCEYLLAQTKPYHTPKTAIVTAEPLLASQRQIIEKALGCQVFSHYGARDFGMIAAQCEQGGAMHLCTASIYFDYEEIPGSNGLYEIFATDLTNRAMPMIRYKINDCTYHVPEQCACGRGYPLIGDIEGRTTDNFVFADGSVVPGVAMTNRLIKVCPEILKLQIVQEEVDQFLVRFVRGAGFRDEVLATVRERFFQLIGQRVNVRLEEVTDIPRERSGKTRLCISHVQRKKEDALCAR
jgi:phenylacetate-CoA ligase